MSIDLDELILKKVKGTGDADIEEKYKIINFKIDKYIISIKITENNKFVDIDEVKINEDFRNFKQKFSSGTIRFIDDYEIN